MSKGRFFCGGSALAVTLAMTLGISPSLAFAQPPVAQTPPPSDAQPPEDDQDATEVEEIVSTGTFIRGTAEDAALPVEVIGRADLLAQGNPSMEELVRNLSEVGLIQSQSARGANAGGIGVSSLNLRNLGSGRTLVTLNGRRLADDPATNSGAINVTGGANQNINAIPTGVLQQVEILKDSGGAAFGSDAVAGVVNFITRRDLNGTELDVRYKWLDGSDGEYDANLRWGRRNDSGNVLLSLEYRHSSPIVAKEIDGIKRSPYIGLGNSIGNVFDSDLGSYQFVMPNQAVTVTRTTAQGGGTEVVQTGERTVVGAGSLVCPTVVTVTCTAALGGITVPNSPYRGAGTAAALFPVQSTTGHLRDDACLEIGGYRYILDATLRPSCAHMRVDDEDIEYGSDNFRLYGDVNFDVTDKIRYHGEILFNKTVTSIRGQDNGSGPAPCDPLPEFAPSTGVAGSQRGCTTVNINGGGAAYSLPGYNPVVFEYLSRYYSNPINGSAPQRVLTDAQILSITGRAVTSPTGPVTASGGALQQGYLPVGFGRMTLPTGSWQAFVGQYIPGQPGGEIPYKNESLLFRTTQQIKGDLGEVFGTVIDYDLSATYSRNMTRLYGSHILVDRLQRGLNGFASNLDDLGADGVGCGATETTGNRTFNQNVPSATPGGPVLVVTTTVPTPYTVGAGGGGDYNATTAGTQRAANGFDPGTAAGNRCYFVNPIAGMTQKSLLNNRTPVASATDVGFLGGPLAGGTTGDFQGYAPGYGLANAPGIMKWLFEERESRVASDNITVDAVFNGQIPKYELWGGPISWAVVGQMRYVNRVATADSLSDRRINDCSFLRQLSQGLSATNNIVNQSSTCTGTAGAFMTAIGPGFGSNPYRETHTYAALLELNLPITDRWTAQVIARNERSKQPGNEEFIAETVMSGSTKYQITDQFSVHASVAEHFDTPSVDEPGQDVVSAAQGGAGFFTNVSGASVSPNSFNVTINNVAVAAETGTNWSAGFDFQSPDRRWNANLDFFSVTITGRPTGVNASTIARAILGIRTANATIDPLGVIDCSAKLGGGTVADLFDPAKSPSLFGGDPFIRFIAPNGQQTVGCINGAQLGGIDGDGDPNNDGNFINDPGDTGLIITTPNRVNAGTEKAQGIEAGLSYRVPEQIYGGNLTLDLDLTVNLVKSRGDVVVFGVNVTQGSDDVGQLAPDLFAITNVLRGSLGVRYDRGRHSFNLRGVYVGPFADGQNIVFQVFQTPGISTANLNPRDPATCLAAGIPTAAQPIPDGFGSSILGPLLVGDGPMDNNCRLPTNRGVKVGNSFIIGATWRWNLPQDMVPGLSDTTLVVSAENLLDRRPPYWRATYHYIPFGSVTPWGRTVAVSLQKKF